jgi:long-chain fatty acid transport protein
MTRKAGLLSSVAAFIVAFGGPATAGGFAVPEQSASFLGTSFAGAAAGGDISSMYWNPAALVTVPGTQAEISVTGGMQSSNIQALPGSSLLGAPGLSSTSGNIFPNQVIPAFYLSHQINADLFVGLGFNAPFGSSTSPANRNWDGFVSSTSSSIATYDLNPTIAYRISPQLSVGVGAQIQYMSANLRNAQPLTGFPFFLPLSSSPDVTVTGLQHWAAGFTAGLLWQPTAATRIGFGYRSGIHENLNGEFTFAGSNPLTSGAVLTSVPIDLPAIATASIRQDLTPTFALLGTAQWTQWSNLQNLNVTCQSNSSIPVKPCGPGQILETVPLNWHDGWFFSAGAEQKLNQVLLLRAGVAYERSPVQSPDEDLVNIMDSNRIWVSTGLQYKINRMMTADLSYAHVFFAGGLINQTDPVNGVTIIGSTQRSADLIAASLKLRFDEPPAPASKIVK